MKRTLAAVMAFFALAIGATVAGMALAVENRDSSPSLESALDGIVVQESTLSELGKLDAGKVKEFVLSIDSLMDSLEKPDTNPGDLDMVMWAVEILPFFEYERVRNNVIIPDAIAMTPYFTGVEHNHILGKAYCETGDKAEAFDASQRAYPYNIEMNARLENPHSSWYADQSYLSTLIHELVHVQGACGTGESAEHTAQIVMVEILSALTLGGNRDALYPLLDEIRGWGLSYLLYDAVNLNDGSEKKLEAYKAFRNSVYGDAFDAARGDKSLRFWDLHSRAELATILHTYSVTPLVKLLEGLEAGAVNLVIPEYSESTGGSQWQKPAYRGRRDFAIDDFVAFVAVVDALVADLAEEQAEKADFERR